MNIMIDYDGTYTADVTLWRKLIPLMHLADHNVYLVTSRGMDTPVELVQDFVTCMFQLYIVLGEPRERFARSKAL